MRILALILLLASAASAQIGRAEWFRQARFGVFMHYLSGKDVSTAADWNRRIDNFDVEGLAKQLQQAGARYFFITLGQNSGYYLSPNKTYDSYVGFTPSHCSRRDLVAGLYKALEPKGISLLVYLPAGAPDRDETAMARLEWKKGPFRNREFQLKWEAVIREWSLRWGNHVKGWWFDGCYWPNTMYRTRDAPNFESFAAAARAGNPNSIVAFNPGVINPIISVAPHEDYTAGEINDVDKVILRRRDGPQLHMLSYLGSSWSAGSAPRYTDEQIVGWTRDLAARDVVVTYDVPRLPNGLIPGAFIAQLTRISAAFQASAPAKR